MRRRHAAMTYFPPGGRGRADPPHSPSLWVPGARWRCGMRRLPGAARGWRVRAGARGGPRRCARVPLRVRKLEPVFAQRPVPRGAAKVSRLAHDGRQPIAPPLARGPACAPQPHKSSARAGGSERASAEAAPAAARRGERGDPRTAPRCAPDRGTGLWDTYNSRADTGLRSGFCAGGFDILNFFSF